MTTDQFKKYFASNYSECIPVGHLYRTTYPHRWFRIHSLHESKRYPDTPEEWELLLNRQNTIITDVLGEDAVIFLVTGYYKTGLPVSIAFEESAFLQNKDLTELELNEFNKENSDDFNKDLFYKAFFCRQTWKHKKLDALLKEIANDELRVFLVSPDKNCIIAPYDGGIDFILKDSRTRDFYMQKYKQWLSKRADGL